MALTFTRTNSNYLTVPYNAVLAFTSAVTICAWVNPSSMTMQRVVSRYTSASVDTEIWGLDVYQNNCRMLMGKVTMGGLFGNQATYSVDAASGGSVPAGTWSFIAGSWDGSTMRVYVNGVQVGTFARTAAMLTSTTAMSIGADFRGGTTAAEYFDGSIEDVRIYNRALTQPELGTMYSTRGSDRNHTNMVFNLEMHGGGPFGGNIAAGTTFKDISNTGLVATTVNSGLKFGEHYLRRRKALSGG